MRNIVRMRMSTWSCSPFTAPVLILHPRLGLRNPRFRLRVWISEGPVGQVFDGFGVFREFSGAPGRSGMVQDKSGRLLKLSFFDNFPEV